MVWMLVQRVLVLEAMIPISIWQEVLVLEINQVTEDIPAHPREKADTQESKDEANRPHDLRNEHDGSNLSQILGLVVCNI